MSQILRNSAKQIEANGKVRVRGIEIYNVIRARRGNVIKQILGEIAMRVNDAYAATRFNVLKNQIAKQRGFARTGLSKTVHVVATISARNPEGLFAAPHVSMTDVDNVSVHGSGANGYSNVMTFSGLNKRRNKTQNGDKLLVSESPG